jgi:trans-aconitate methyltransferase
MISSSFESHKCRCLWLEEIDCDEVSAQRFNLLETFTFDSNLKQDNQSIAVKLEVYSHISKEISKNKLYRMSVNPILMQLKSEEISTFLNKLIDSLKEKFPP